MKKAERKGAGGAYFFAQDEEFVPFYDAVEELINPYVHIIHDLMIELLVESLKDRRKHLRGWAPCILVVGSGTGAEVLRITKLIPAARILAVDFSPLMNDQLRRKYAKEFADRELESSVQLLGVDFLSDECKPTALLSRLHKEFGSKKFDAAVVGFVTHHYHYREKLEFYKRIRSVLRGGGALVHGDLFNFRSRWLSRLAHRVGEQWTAERLTGGIQLSALRKIAPRLREAWLYHWNNTHIYSPIDPETGHRTQSIGGAVGHVEMLRGVGFAEIECPFRMWETGILWAR